MEGLPSFTALYLLILNDDVGLKPGQLHIATRDVYVWRSVDGASQFGTGGRHDEDDDYNIWSHDIWTHDIW